MTPKLAGSAAVAVLMVLAVSGILPPYWVTLLNYLGIAALVALGLVVLTGVGGMTSFGHAAFVGFGAYTTALLTTGAQLSPWVGLMAATVTTAFAALVLGTLTVRLHGHFLALGTLAWGVSIFYVFGGASFFGGHDGLSGIPPLKFGSYNLVSPSAYLIVVISVLGLSLLAVSNLLRGRMGRAIRALRRNREAAQAFGVDIPGTKLIVFVVSAILAGLAGWLYAHFQRSIAPSMFGVNAGVEYLLMAVVGGSGRLAGAILGSAFVTVLRDQLQNVLPLIFGGSGNYQTIAFGALLVILLQVAPKGLWPMIAGPPSSRRVDTSNVNVSNLVRRARPDPGAPLLKVDRIGKSFGGLKAVDDVSFEVRSGEVVGLIGPNGAGKSTTFNLICGSLPLTNGKLSFSGQSIAGASPREIAAAGIARSFQHSNIEPEASVVENVALGGHTRGRAGVLSAILGLDRMEEASIFAEAERQLARVGLSDRAYDAAGDLALGQLRLLEVARALMLDPILLLLDEPAAGLRFAEKVALAALLRQLKSEGVTVLVVEHDMEFLLNLVDRVVVLDFGKKLVEDTPQAIRSNERVIEAYLGGVE
jgi:branched-chain amino acid transport system permease protein